MMSKRFTLLDRRALHCKTVKTRYRKMSHYKLLSEESTNIKYKIKYIFI